MKISCLCINSNLIQTNEQKKIVEVLNQKLYEIGEVFSLISYFGNNFDNIKSILNSDYQLSFFIGTSSSVYNHNIKENLSKIFNDKLTSSESSYKSLTKYCSTNNIPFSVQEEMEVLLPKDCIPLCSDKYYNNGFMYKFNNKYIIFLPDNIEFINEVFNIYILPLLYDIVEIKKDFQVLKCFGITEKDLKMLIGNAYNQNDVEIQIINDGIDNTIYIRYDNNSSDKAQIIISEICGNIQKFLYSTDNSSIYTTLKNLIQLQNKSISICETITSGYLNYILSENGLNSHIDSIKCFNNYDSIIREFEIEKNIIDNYGKYSVNSVYEFSHSLLEKSTSDIVVFILGDKNDEYCYIAIGDIEGIHVYKNKINIKDKTTIENISKTAIFYLIKKLKQNNLQFM